MINRYGLEWDEEQWDDLNIELACFRHNIGPDEGGLGKAGHFRNIADILWGPKCQKYFIWHPWAEQMLDAACKWQYLSVSGAGNAGKSEFFALWAIVNWLCDPVNTMILVTSTSLNASRKRIWGAITDYFRAAKNMPGSLVDSLGIIRTQDQGAGVKMSDKSGISLVAGEPAKEKESMDKVMGAHNQRVILIGDELPALSHNLVKFAQSNLATNPEFQFVGIGNPRSKYDPHGILSTPKNGWESISESDYEWETKTGYAIRFDAEQSPNVLAKRTVYPFLAKLDDILRSRHANGEDSLEYWSQTRGFWSPEGSDPDCIYSEADISYGDATEDKFDWLGNPTPISACDPARSNGGDAFCAVFGLIGVRDNGVHSLLVTDVVELFERKSVNRPYLFQIAEQYKVECIKRGIRPENVGYDATGGAGTFGQILGELWDNSLYKVDFNGRATTRPHGSDNKPGTDLFADRVSEIWMVGKDYLRSGQLKGLNTVIIGEMLARKEVARKQGMGGIRRAVEGKRAMKKRVKKSPDHADALFVLLDLCRERFQFRANTTKLINKHAQERWSAAKERMEMVDANPVPTNLNELNTDRHVKTRWTPDVDEESDWAQVFNQ